MKIWYDRDFSLVSSSYNLHTYIHACIPICILTLRDTTAHRHPQLQLSRLPGLVLLDRTVFPDTARLQRADDGRAPPPHGRHGRHHQRHCSPDPAQSLQQADCRCRHNHTNSSLCPCRRTAKRRFLLGVFVPGVLPVCRGHRYPVYRCECKSPHTLPPPFLP